MYIQTPIERTQNHSHRHQKEVSQHKQQHHSVVHFPPLPPLPQLPQQLTHTAHIPTTTSSSKHYEQHILSVVQQHQVSASSYAVQAQRAQQQLVAAASSSSSSSSSSQQVVMLPTSPQLYSPQQQLSNSIRSPTHAHLNSHSQSPLQPPSQLPNPSSAHSPPSSSQPIPRNWQHVERHAPGAKRRIEDEEEEDDDEHKSAVRPMKPITTTSSSFRQRQEDEADDMSDEDNDDYTNSEDQHEEHKQVKSLRYVARRAQGTFPAAASSSSSSSSSSHSSAVVVSSSPPVASIVISKESVYSAAPVRYSSPAAAFAAQRSRFASKSSARTTHTSSPVNRAPVLPLRRYRVTDEETAMCCVCESGESTDENQILLCDGRCCAAYHQDCVVQDTSIIPDGDWFCNEGCRSHHAAAAASSSSSSSSSPTDSNEPFNDNELYSHIIRMRLSAEAKRAAQPPKVPQSTHNNQPSSAPVPSKSMPTAMMMYRPLHMNGSIESLRSVTTADEFWQVIAAFVDDDRLYHSSEYLKPLIYNLNHRFSPDSGTYYKQVWTEEDVASGEDQRHRTYIKPVKGTEKHDDVEWENYYQEDDGQVPGTPTTPTATSGLRSRHQSSILKRIPQAPVRVSLHMAFVPKSKQQVRSNELSINPPSSTSTSSSSALKGEITRMSFASDSSVDINMKSSPAASPSHESSSAAAASASTSTLVIDCTGDADKTNQAITAAAVLPDDMLPPFPTPPPPYFTLRAIDRHYAKEIGFEPESDHLAPSAPYRIDNNALQQLLLANNATNNTAAAATSSTSSQPLSQSSSQQPISTTPSCNKRRRIGPSPMQQCQGWANITGPFSGHYLFPQLLSTAPGEPSENEAQDGLWSIPPSLFDYALLPSGKNPVRVYANDPLATRVSTPPFSPQHDLAVVEGDEVSSALWIARRELLNQCNVNNQRKATLREACVAAKAFDKPTHQARLKVQEEQRAVLAEYRKAFPTSYQPAIDHEQQRAQAIQRAAHRAGKSISTRGKNGGYQGVTTNALGLLVDNQGVVLPIAAHTYPHLSDEQRRRLQRVRSNEKQRLQREKVRLDKLKRETPLTDIESDEDDEDEEDDSTNASASPRKQRQSLSSRRMGVGGKAPRSSSHKRGSSSSRRYNNVIVISIPKPTAQQLKQQAKHQVEQVRACMDGMLNMIEELHRSAAVAKLKSKKIEQLRERTEKRQRDLNEFEDQRAYTDPARMVLDAIVSQIELDEIVTEEPIIIGEPAAAAAKSPPNVPPRLVTEDSLDSITSQMTNDGNESKSDKSDHDMKSETTAENKSESTVERSVGPSTPTTEDQEETQPPVTSSTPMDLSNELASIPSPPLAPASSSSNLPPPIRLPAPHLYIEPSYCPHSHPPRAYSIAMVYVRCDGCSAWWHLKCLGFSSHEDLIQIYRVYCKPCQESGLRNENIAHGARRKRGKPGEMPAWSAVAKNDAAMALHMDGMDDAERLELEEQECEKQLRFLYLPERHQATIFIDDNGNEMQVVPTLRPPKKKLPKPADEDEIAVMHDHEPYEWMTVRLKRLNSYKLTLTKSATKRSRSSPIEYTLSNEVVMKTTYYPPTAEGKREFELAKLAQSIPTRIRKKIEQRQSYFSADATRGSSMLTPISVTSHSTLSRYTKAALTSTFTPPPSPGSLIHSVSRSGRPTKRKDTRELIAARSQRHRKHESDSSSSTSSEDEDDDRQQSDSDNSNSDDSDDSSRNSSRSSSNSTDESNASESEAEVAKPIRRRAGRPVSRPQPTVVVQPLPTFEPGEIASVTASRAHPRTTRIKLKLRIKKSLLPSDVMPQLKAALTAANEAAPNRRGRSAASAEVKRKRVVESSSEDEDEFFMRSCIVCGLPADNPKRVILCDSCPEESTNEAHLECLGYDEVPKEKYFCSECVAGAGRKFTMPVPPAACNRQFHFDGIIELLYPHITNKKISRRGRPSKKVKREEETNEEETVTSRYFKMESEHHDHNSECDHDHDHDHDHGKVDMRSSPTLDELAQEEHKESLSERDADEEQKEERADKKRAKSKKMDIDQPPTPTTPSADVDMTEAKPTRRITRSRGTL